MSEYIILKGDIKENKQDILDILKNNFEGQWDERYRWNYETCPHGYAQCWLAKDKDTQAIVGTAALFPRKINFEGKPIFAAIAGDYAVDKEHRAFGPAMQLQKEIQSKINNMEFKFIYGIPNKLSRLVFYRIGHKKIGKIEKFIKILNIERMSRDNFIQYIELRLNSRSNIISKIVNRIFYSKNVIRLIDIFIKFTSKENRQKKYMNYLVEMPNSFDERFDVFWKKVSKQYNIVGERTSDFLNWRYKNSALEDYKIFCLLDDKKEIVGYIIYYLQDNKYHIVDMLFFTDEYVLNSLLAEFAFLARDNKIGAIIIDYLGKDQLVNKLKEFNFFLVKKDLWDVIIYSSDISSDSKLLDKNNWHLFTGDYDI